MTCLCGHPETHHARARGRCTGYVRIYISPAPGYKLRPGDRVLDKAEAERVVNEAAAKVERAPSYEKQFKTLLRRGHVSIHCQCKLYHELPVPSEETGVTLWGPDGNPIA